MSSAEQNPEPAAAGTQAEATGVSFFDQVVQATELEDRDHAKGLVNALVESVTKGMVKVDKNVTRSLQNGIDAIDQAISKQLAAIMHHEKFQKLEGTWRGLNYLVMNTETSTMLKIKMLNCSKRDLYKDLDKAIEFDQSHLFKEIYEAEFGTAGGQPFGTMIADYEFTGHPDDTALLNMVSGVAASSFCPFISAASPSLLGLNSWQDLSKPRDLAKIFDAQKYAKWNSFRESEDARFVVLTMPRVLARLPYGSATKPVDEFRYEEVPLGGDGEPIGVAHDNYCWMNAAYVYGTRLTDCFAKTGWCTAIRGELSGGKIEDLPTHVFTTDDGDEDMKCPTEVGITDRREAELSDLGFLPLVHYKRSDYAVFFGAQTAQKPKKYEGPDGIQATENAAISARLPVIMATSRIAHYLKVMARSRIGGFMERKDCEKWLNSWIMNYVLGDESADAREKAKFPLAEARIDVTEVPGDPGHYNAVAFLRPWLQLERLTTSLRTVTKIPNQ